MEKLLSPMEQLLIYQQMFARRDAILAAAGDLSAARRLSAPAIQPSLPSLPSSVAAIAEETWRKLRIRQLESLMLISRTEMIEAEAAAPGIDVDDIETPLPISKIPMEKEFDGVCQSFTQLARSTSTLVEMQQLAQRALVPNNVGIVMTSGNLIDELSVNLLLPKVIQSAMGTDTQVVTDDTTVSVYFGSEDPTLELLNGTLTIDEAIHSKRILKLESRADRCAVNVGRDSSDDEASEPANQRRGQLRLGHGHVTSNVSFRRVPIGGAAGGKQSHDPASANHRLLATFKHVKLPTEWAFLDGRLRTTKHSQLPPTRKPKTQTKTGGKKKQNGSYAQNGWAKDEEDQREPERNVSKHMGKSADPLKKYYFIFVTELPQVGKVWAASFPTVVQTNCGKQNCLSYAAALLYYSYMYENGDPFCAVESHSLRKRQRVRWPTLLHGMNWILLTRIGCRKGLTFAHAQFLLSKLVSVKATSANQSRPDSSLESPASPEQGGLLRFGWSDLFGSPNPVSRSNSPDQNGETFSRPANNLAFWDWFYGAVNLIQYVETHTKDFTSLQQQQLLQRPGGKNGIVPRGESTGPGPWDSGFVMGFLSEQMTAKQLRAVHEATGDKVLALRFSDTTHEGISLYSCSIRGDLVPITEFCLEDVKQMNLPERIFYCPFLKEVGIRKVFPDNPINLPRAGQSPFPGRPCIEQWCPPKQKGVNGHFAWRVAIVFDDEDILREKILGTAANDICDPYHSFGLTLPPSIEAHELTSNRSFNHGSSDASRLSVTPPLTFSSSTHFPQRGLSQYLEGVCNGSLRLGQPRLLCPSSASDSLASLNQLLSDFGPAGHESFPESNATQRRKRGRPTQLFQEQEPLAKSPKLPLVSPTSPGALRDDPVKRSDSPVVLSPSPLSSGLSSPSEGRVSVIMSATAPSLSRLSELEKARKFSEGSARERCKQEQKPALSQLEELCKASEHLYRNDVQTVSTACCSDKSAQNGQPRRWSDFGR